MPLEDAGARGEQRVFVEIGASQEPGFPTVAPPGRPSKTWRVAHVLATEGRTVTMPWQLDQGNGGEVVIGELAVLAHLSDVDPGYSDVAPGYVRLELALRDTADARLEAEHDTQFATVKTSVVLRDQQTIVVKTEAGPARPSQTLLVTPYVIRSDRDLRRLFQCKLQARAEVTETQ